MHRVHVSYAATWVAGQIPGAGSGFVENFEPETTKAASRFPEGGLSCAAKAREKEPPSRDRPPDCARTAWVRERRPDNRASEGYRGRPATKCTTTRGCLAASGSLSLRISSWSACSSARDHYDIFRVVAQEEFLGDRRESNSSVVSHNHVPKPLGHGHHASLRDRWSRMERAGLRENAHERHGRASSVFLTSAQPCDRFLSYGLPTVAARDFA